jgi:hypothetical protein
MVRFGPRATEAEQRITHHCTGCRTIPETMRLRSHRVIPNHPKETLETDTPKAAQPRHIRAMICNKSGKIFINLLTGV